MIALSITLGALCSTFGFAYWQPDGNPVCTAKGDQLSIDIISDGVGGAIMAWYDGGVCAQRVDSSGVMLWKTNGIAVSKAAGGELPYIVSDSAEGAIITWVDYHSAADHGVYAQRLDSSGELMWGAGGVPVCTTACTERSRDITTDGASGAIISWSDNRSGRGCDVYAQRVDATGKVLWKENGVSICSAEDDQGFIQIVSDGEGGAIVCWADFRSGDHFSIYAQRVDGSGKTLWETNGVPVCTVLGNRLPRVVSDGAGGAIIAWRDPRRTTNYDIYAQRIGGSGTALWQKDGVPVCTVAGAKWWPILVSDGFGGAVITWRDYRSHTNYDIYAQRVSPRGKMLWKTNGVPICTNTINERYHDIASDRTGGAIVVWYDDRRTGNYDIYAQRVNASGNTLWKANGMAVCTAPEDQQYPSAAVDNNGNAIVTWLDFRSTTHYDIYAQRLRPDGKIWPAKTTGSQRRVSNRPKTGLRK